ncbi:hypothetical protein HY214_01935 [Candidatus Roizmanbacteria bacterium]|nr:hypothetical protein [Candidatus Roizmanbacteria bacterium]
MPIEVIHSAILILVFGASFVFARSPLAAYDVQLIAFCIGVYILLHRMILFGKHLRFIQAVLFSIIIVTIVVSTGGANSPLFFLFYFLLFSLSLLLEPIISLTATLTLIICLLISLPDNQSLKTLLPILSLAFLTPFALLLGQEYLEHQKAVNKLSRTNEETFLFLSLILKNHLKEIHNRIENFVGDHDLSQMRKHTHEMEQVIEKFENKS